MKVAIIGSGISGLSAAYYLRKFSEENNIQLKLDLFEKCSRVGGIIDTFRSNQYLTENGPDSFITNKPWAIELVKELGIENDLQPTNENNRKTYVYFNNRLNELPGGFYMMAPSSLIPFIKSDFFSMKEKLRILAETIIPRKNVSDESLHSFVTRRFGKNLFIKAAQPLIGGIYVADPEKLSMKATMPQFLEMEKNSGSVIRGLLKKSVFRTSEQSGPRYNLFYSFKNGMSYLVDKLIESVKFDNLHMNTEVKQLSQTDEKWDIKTNGNQGNYDAVILSTPTFVACDLLKDIDSGLSDMLSGFEYASSVVVNLFHKKTDFNEFPEGFGIVIPSFENLNVIACSLFSNKFSGRIDENGLIIRCFLGGKLNEKILDLGDEEIIRIISEELKVILKLKKFTDNYLIKRYEKAMPQYNVGHLEKINEILDKVSKYRGLAICGSMYHGVGIPDCINSGKIAAGKVSGELKS